MSHSDGRQCSTGGGFRAPWRAHPAYNAAITASVSELMLQNLVRLRYGDVPFFLEIGGQEVGASQWTVRTRSCPICCTLSQNVETPRSHQSAGLVTVAAATRLRVACSG